MGANWLPAPTFAKPLLTGSVAFVVAFSVAFATGEVAFVTTGGTVTFARRGGTVAFAVPLAVPPK